MSAKAELLDSVYRAALEPAAWVDVMQQLAVCFPSSAQAFYYLHRNPRRLQVVDLAGIETRWLQTFDPLYFAPDNPWIRMSPQLHRPGVVRTNERLDRILKQRGALYRSAYYNDWMRPQHFKLTLGNTLLAEGDLIANITLFRPPDMKTFSAAEVREFEALSGHMTRALRMAMRLEHPQNVPAAAVAFEASAQPIAVLDRRRRVLYANSAMETLLRRRDGLALRQAELVASNDADQPALEAYIDRMALRWRDRHGDDPVPLELRDRDGRAMTLQAIPTGTPSSPASAGMPCCLLMVGSRAPGGPMSAQDLRDAFGLTPAEARLAQALTRAGTLRDAAQALNITYETARACLKVVFGKAGVHTQAQLVAVVLRGADRSVTGRRSSTHS
ncbi:MAG TPA: PAS domain-containing protein [Burkholderiaceae bacterium]